MAKYKLLQGKHHERHKDGTLKTYVSGDIVEFEELPVAFVDRFELVDAPKGSVDEEVVSKAPDPTKPQLPGPTQSDPQPAPNPQGPQQTPSLAPTPKP